MQAATTKYAQLPPETSTSSDTNAQTNQVWITLALAIFFFSVYIIGQLLFNYWPASDALSIPQIVGSLEEGVAAFMN
ncbi:MAG: hypothetical protein AAF798_10100 [Bacteroidota bacterium]